VAPEHQIVINNVSLVTTVLNENKSIELFLASYRDQKARAEEFIILDGGSTDGTTDVVSKFILNNLELNITLIVDSTCSRGCSAGPIARGRNMAIENAKYDIVVVTDAGCKLHRDWLYELIDAFTDADVVSGWYEPLMNNKFQRSYAQAYLLPLQCIDRDNFLPSSRNIAFRKECWQAVGGYPELTYNAEDTIFDLALKKAGYKFVFCEKALVYWDVPTSMYDVCKKHYTYGYGDGQYGLFGNHFKSTKKLLKLIMPITYLYSYKSGYRGLMCGIIKYCIDLSWRIGYFRGNMNVVDYKFK
jgi:glycosyltransferase involved in cell wall biosynthesis